MRVNKKREKKGRKVIKKLHGDTFVVVLGSSYLMSSMPLLSDLTTWIPIALMSEVSNKPWYVISTCFHSFSEAILIRSSRNGNTCRSKSCIWSNSSIPTFLWSKVFSWSLPLINNTGLSNCMVVTSSTGAIRRQRTLAGNLSRNQKEIEGPLHSLSNHLGILPPEKMKLVSPASWNCC